MSVFTYMRRLQPFFVVGLNLIVFISLASNVQESWETLLLVLSVLCY